ncbi:MAG TPA: MAPEG family protein [Caulobacterales bacterium]|nr:MAPEG family protein [Caulobacterales bacterium]
MSDRGVVFLWGIPVVVLTVGAILLAPAWPVPGAWDTNRFRLGASCAAAIGVWLVAAVLLVSTHRLFSSADAPGPALSEPTPALRLKLAFLQNTLEQVVLAAIAYLAFAATAPTRELSLLPIDVILFWIGRACFLLGQANGMRGRAFGFALTFAPTLALYLLLLSTLL